MSAPAAPVLIPPRGGVDIGDYTLRDFAAKWMSQQCDLAQLGYHRAANDRLVGDGDGRDRVVFMGDSITEFWAAIAELGGEGWRALNRGIAGQSSTQMLLRFGDDAVDLAPRLIILLCGTNDLRSYAGAPGMIVDVALGHIRRSVTAMADIAQARGIALALATLPPVGRQLETYRDPAGILEANGWLREFADTRRLRLIDYHAALLDQEGFLPPELSDDGVHPNAAGYARMRIALQPTLDAHGYRATGDEHQG